MSDIMAFDPARRTSAQAILDLVTLGYLNEQQDILDATYGKGRFWKKWQPCLLQANDSDPSRGVSHFNYHSLPWEDGLFDVTVFDPPFKLNGTGGGAGPASCDDDYGVADGYRSLDTIKRDIYGGLNECTRVTKVGGLVLYKTQDQVSGGHKRFLSKDDYLEFPLPRVARGSRIIKLVDELYIHGYRKQPAGRVQKHSRSNVSVLQVYRRTA